MMGVSSRRGSAILIVLGMLSFMVVSAVGFAVFMRQSRLPSSYLRRSSSSRYLLKAALANAISRIDGCYAYVEGRGGRCEGILDDPYPGVGPKVEGNGRNSSHRDDGNYWLHRVFTPFGQIDPDETVSTLTLEGLAYLPPAIINEARVFSRTTRTAQWSNLSYDSGRYAFTAYDVSDCFDINKLFAGERRFSAANQRVNLSSLFPDNGSQLDTILEQCSKVQNKNNIPFTSIADFNIVAGNSQFSPFCRHIRNGNSVSMYNMGDHQFVSNALFVTDTWFPSTNSASSTTKRINLAVYQPFDKFNARNMDEVDDMRSSRTPPGCDKAVYQILMSNIGGVGLACLYDYLDKDRVPVSLALPTVETQPMICALSADFDNGCILRNEGAPINVTANITPAGSTATRTTITRTVTPYVLRVPQSTLTVSGVAVFPFKRVNGNRKGTWKIETLTAIFFAKSDLKGRVDRTSPLRPLKDYWDQTGTQVRNGVIWSKGQLPNISFNDNIVRTQDAFREFAIPVSVADTKLPICYEVHEVKTETDLSSGTSTQTEDWTKFTADQTREGTPLFVLDGDGKIAAACEQLYVNGPYNDKVVTESSELRNKYGLTSQNFVDSIDAGGPYRPYLAVWVRIVDSRSTLRGGGEATVDLVPATAADDNEVNAANINSAFLPEMYKMGGGGVPLMDFRMDHEFSFTVSQNGNGFQQLLSQTAPLKREDWKALFAPDPRYNFAPEDWFGTQDDDVSAAKWRSYVGAEASGALIGENGRDRDIFMFTSDQEYLQAAGELAFLPFTEPMEGRADFIGGEFMDAARYHGRNDFNVRQVNAEAGFANWRRFWRTYTAVDHGDGYDDLYALRKDRNETPRFELVAGEGDFRVNPFSPDSRVLMAALKDTPYDYYVASTNDDTSVNPTVTMAPGDRSRWAFCKESSVAKLSEDELLDIADRLGDAFKVAAENGETHWKAIYDDMAWYDVANRIGDEQKSIFGMEDLDQPLHGVDRKYLYSFWRECFQNRQQLFLVFMRAEPLTVGGSGTRACGSSQMGARGVALVWRDPQPPTKGGANRPRRTTLTTTSAWEQYYKNFAPHRTRVLFYHQFD